MSVDYRPEYDPADVDSDYGHTGGDITVPTFTANMKPFRFWCQKALPLVYDDSLSYYEVLCKVVKQMNDFLTDLQTATGAIDQFAQQFVINQQFLNDMADQLGQNVQDLEDYINDRLEDYMTAYTQLQNYVNNYFDNLDVQQEINNKLDEMAEDGTFNTLFDPVITAWMTAKTAQIDAAIANQDAIQAQQNGRISVLEGRMDTFSGLPSGSTSGNAELLDIRTNFLGETYPTAGDAVRASDMIASGFQSISATYLEDWDGNAASSVYDSIQIDVSGYKGGHVAVIGTFLYFLSELTELGKCSVYGTNTAGAVADSNAANYYPGNNNSIFTSYTQLTTSISGEERLLLQFAIPDDYAYQYLKIGNFEHGTHEGTYTEPLYIVYANSWSKTQVDPTLTIAGAAADAKAAGDAIDELNERLSDVEDVTVEEKVETTTTNIRPDLTWEDGNMNLSGGVGTGTDKRHSNKIAVAVGDIIAYQNTNFLFNYVTAFNGDVAVSEKGVLNVNSYTVPVGVTHVVLSEYTSRGTATINYTHSIVTLVNALEDDVNSALKDTPVCDMNAESVTWTTGKYMGNNGNIGPLSGLNYSSQIAVQQGDVLLYANDNYKFRFVCAYNSSGVAVSNKGSANEVKFYIVPEGIVSVVVTVYDAALNSGTSLLHISTPVGKRAKMQSYGNGSVIARADTMTDESTLTLPENNCKIGSRYQFSCKVSEFGSVEFIMGTTHVVVDETNIIFKYGTTTQVTVPHGLTIGTEFLLILQNETSIRPSYVGVSSLGNRFEYNGSPNITFLLDSGIPTIKCVEGTLTNCSFSFTSSHIFKPVWIFGDSYLSWYDTRWTYYAAEDRNTDNVFFSGYAGQNSQSALAILNNELKLATPKILVWCLGMNDPDTENAVNVGWEMCYNQVKKICDYRNIELVLYTTPTTTEMNNRQKNAIVRASGYRYVDVDGLLRINESGDWIDGALAVDNVHPTDLGAKIIYHKFCSDLPEIMTR